MVAVLNRQGPPTQAEFHEVISTRSDRWYSACLKITRNRDLAEDAVQDALLSAWNKRHQFDRSARLDTWIHRIAINAALQLLRKSKPGVFEALEQDVEAPTAGPEQLRADEELGRDLALAMRPLSEIERVCFVLKHLEQWRLKEIAEEIGSNTGTVKQAIFRAVKKLRLRMAALQREAL
jgi:RNA polymerase sigma-70 factor (ECF subfamily)